jgi:flagellar motor switch protein FliN/FliY
MTDGAGWIGRLESEIGRELGQEVALLTGGEGVGAGSEVAVVLETPEARLTIAADAAGLRDLIVESRLLEEEQADAEMVRELWTGILNSVAGRLGGRVAEDAETRGEIPCTLRLGQAVVRMSLGIGESGRAASAGTAAPAVEASVSEPVAREAHDRGTAVREPGNYDLLLELELEAVVRFGSREMELRDLLELGPGDVVELDRQLTDPVDLIVGDKIVARGEVVLVEGNFGLRVTEVAEPRKRLESIRCLG